MHLLSAGDNHGIPLLFIHGNFSSSTYFEELMIALPSGYRALAVDLRGYGETEDLSIDATQGAQDWADDLYALFQTLNISSAHLAGWSAGAAAIIQFALDHPGLTKSLTLIAPVSPYGFGGSKDPQGSPCYEDYAGSGGGVVSADFVARIVAQDRTTDSPFSPRNVIRHAFTNNPSPLVREEDLLTGSLQQKTGAQRYPGDTSDSPNWPHIAPGRYGPINAVSPKYLNLDGLTDISPKPPILWVRGDKDSIISNQSLSDIAVLGQQNLLPGWPGGACFPPQPMLEQTRQLLQRYQDRGGHFRETVIPGAGHSPFLEKPQLFLQILTDFLNNCNR